MSTKKLPYRPIIAFLKYMMEKDLEGEDDEGVKMQNDPKSDALSLVPISSNKLFECLHCINPTSHDVQIGKGTV